jgi:hypothetical protein
MLQKTAGQSGDSVRLLGEMPMKKYFAVASVGLLGLVAAALAQPAPQPQGPAAGAPAQGAPAGRGGRGPAEPPPLPFPVGGTDNISDGDYVIGPEYSVADEMRPHPAWATGELHQFVMLAKDSKIYPGRKRKVGYVADPARSPGGRGNAVPGDVQWEDAPYEPRPVWVYIPAGTNPRTPMPVIIPLVSRKFNITFTRDPEGRATLGGSSGAAAAFTMAWFHPERYRRTIIFSPTFVNQQSPVDPANPRGAWEYHATLIPNTPKKPIRIWMQVGERDNRYQDEEGTWHNWVMAANRTAAALKAKGYNYRYVFSKDAGHTDNRVREQTMAAALEYVWQGYKPSGR